MIPVALRLPVVAAALCAVAQLAAGCGSSSASLAAGDATRLHADVAGIRAAAAAHNPAAARAAVRTLEADVGRLRAVGVLAPADASVLLSDASQVDRQVSLGVHAPAPAPPSSGAGPSSGPAGSAGGAGQGNGHGEHGHGRGGGGGDGGDGGD